MTLSLSRDRVSLCALDFGGDGAPVVLLHGLAGYGGEWSESATWLRRSHRVLAPDQRGHGVSTRRPADVTREAFVEDAAAWIREVAGSPAAVIGQSLGGHTAFLLAARHSALVSALVIAEASPAGDADAVAVSVESWLRSWPVPFANEDAAVSFFGGESLWSRTWTRGLEHRADGLWPRFDVDVMLACLDGARRSYWDELALIKCPTLIVRAHGGLDESTARRMQEVIPGSKVAVVTGAKHDVHLEQPDQWQEVVRGFLRSVRDSPV